MCSKIQGIYIYVCVFFVFFYTEDITGACLRGTVQQRHTLLYSACQRAWNYSKHMCVYLECVHDTETASVT